MAIPKDTLLIKVYVSRSKDVELYEDLAAQRLRGPRLKELARAQLVAPVSVPKAKPAISRRRRRHGAKESDSQATIRAVIHGLGEAADLVETERPALGGFNI